MSLQKKLEQVLEGTTGTYGVAVKNLETGESASINGDDLFQTASSCKVAILATLFNEVEKGHLSLDTRLRFTEKDLVPGSGVFQLFDIGAEISVKDLALLMIIVSDNQATDKILEMVGKEKVNAFTEGLGLKGTHLEHTIWELFSAYVEITPESEVNYQELEEKLDAPVDRSSNVIFNMNQPNNVSTPEEMNLLLEFLAKKKLVSSHASEKMIEILKNQKFGHRLPYLLPEGVSAANKTGTIGSVVNDVGIVYFPDDKGCFVISVFSTGSETPIEAEKTIAELARAAYDHFAQ